MDFDCYSPYGQLFDDADIAQIEKAVGYSIPDDYRDFLTQRGGGDIIAETRISFGGVDGDVLVLYGKDGPLDLDPAGRDLRLGDAASHYPHPSLIIGDDLGGNSYFACWENGTFSIRWMGYLKDADHVHVADTFTEFLNKIEVSPRDA